MSRVQYKVPLSPADWLWFRLVGRALRGDEHTGSTEWPAGSGHFLTFVETDIDRWEYTGEVTMRVRNTEGRVHSIQIPIPWLKQHETKKILGRLYGRETVVDEVLARNPGVRGMHNTSAQDIKS